MEIRVSGIVCVNKHCYRIVWTKCNEIHPPLFLLYNVGHQQQCNKDFTTLKALIATVGHLSKCSLNLKTTAEIFLTCRNTRCMSYIICCHPKFTRPIYDIYTQQNVRLCLHLKLRYTIEVINTIMIVNWEINTTLFCSLSWKSVHFDQVKPSSNSDRWLQ